MSDGHGVQKTLKIACPKIKKLPQFREVRMQVMLLPNVILQDSGMVGQMVEDIGGRQPVPFELATEVDADHEASPERNIANLAIPNAHWQLEVPKKLSDIRMLAACWGEC
jgi:hypothetical protein